jgi:hypothetical protein
VEMLGEERGAGRSPRSGCRYSPSRGCPSSS